MYIGNHRFQKGSKKCTTWRPISLTENQFKILSTAVYPMRFANSLINDFESNEYDPDIPSCLFNDFESRPIVLIHIPFCNVKGKVSKQLLRKLKAFTKEKKHFRNCLEKTESQTACPFKGETSIRFW